MFQKYSIDFVKFQTDKKFSCKFWWLNLLKHYIWCLFLMCYASEFAKITAVIYAASPCSRLTDPNYLLHTQSEAWIVTIHIFYFQLASLCQN